MKFSFFLIIQQSLSGVGVYGRVKFTYIKSIDGILIIHIYSIYTHIGRCRAHTYMTTPHRNPIFDISSVKKWNKKQNKKHKNE